MARNKHRKKSSDGPGALSSKLRTARMAKGFTLPQVAGLMHLREEQVGALEDGNFEHFKAEVFVKGYLRTYAGLLEIDADEVLELYDGSQPAPEEDKPEVEESDSRSVLPQLNLEPRDLGLIAGGILIFIIALWLVFSGDDETDVESAAPQKEQDQQDSAEDASEVAAAKPVAEPVAPAVSTPEQTTEKAAPAPLSAAPAEESEPAIPSGELRLVFSDQCWVEVRDSTRKLLLVDMRNAGDEEVFQGEPPYRVLLGDVSAVKVYYQGELQSIARDPGKNSARVTIGE